MFRLFMGTSFRCAVTTAVYFLVIVTASYVTGTSQKIIFYDQANCPQSGKNVTINYYDDKYDLRNTWMANATSTRIVGRWTIHLKNADGSNTCNLTDSGSGTLFGRCINRSAWFTTNCKELAIYSVTWDDETGSHYPTTRQTTSTTRPTTTSWKPNTTTSSQPTSTKTSLPTTTKKPLRFPKTKKFYQQKKNAGVKTTAFKITWFPIILVLASIFV